MATRTRIRERMRKLLESWQRSGEPAARFCRRHGITPQKLGYWRRVLERGNGSAASRPRFVPVRLVGDEVNGAGVVEIVLGGDCRVLVREGVSRELLREVMAVVREGC